MPADMKELIASAAKKLLIEKNVKKLTVKDIVEECHITRQTFYYHFEDIPHLLQWMIERAMVQMRAEAKLHGDSESQLRYFFLISIQLKPYVDRTRATNYGAELDMLLQEAVIRISEEIAEEKHLYDTLTREESRIVLRYHAQAMIGFLNTWTDADTKSLDTIVHTVYRIMSGQITIDPELLED